MSDPEPYDPTFCEFLKSEVDANQTQTSFQSCMHINFKKGETRLNPFDQKCPACKSPFYTTSSTDPITIKFTNRDNVTNYYKNKCIMCKAEWRIIQKPVRLPIFKDGVYHALTSETVEHIIFGDDDLLRTYDNVRTSLDLKRETESVETSSKPKRTCVIC